MRVLPFQMTLGRNLKDNTAAVVRETLCNYGDSALSFYTLRITVLS